jgi:DnaJ-class molecular chaperone
LPLLLHISQTGQISKLSFACRFFGGGGGGPFGGFPFGGGGGFQEEEEQIPKGNNVYVELEVTLKDLYLGNTFTVLLISSHTVIV